MCVRMSKHQYNPIWINHGCYIKIRDVVGEASAKGGGGQTPRGAFWSNKTTLGAFSRCRRRLGNLENTTFSPKKSIFKEKIYDFWENFPQKLFLQNIFWQKKISPKIFLQIFFSKNFFNSPKIFWKFWKFLKIVAYNAKKSIFRKNWWVTKTTWGYFSITNATSRAKSEKAPLTTSLIKIIYACNRKDIK